MNTQTKILLIVFSFLIISCHPKQKTTNKREYKYTPDTTFIYKKVDSTELKMEVIFPKNSNSKKLRSAIAFFYGGGWVTGTTSQFAPQAEHYAKKGYVTFLIEYRIRSRNKTTPFESLKDAKSAIRYIKKNALQFNVDSAKIIACGGSAGGHLAAATALISGYNDCQDDTTISTKPEALILFNPVIDNGPKGYAYDRIGNQYKKFSPLYNIQKDAPPTIILIGTKDQLIPLTTIDKYKLKMDSVGSFCEVRTFKDQKHGFFNYWHSDNYNKTLEDVDAFLHKIQE